MSILVDFFPPPNITLSEINMNQLTFTWDYISMSLSGVQYFVNSSNCVCPSTTSAHSVKCDFNTSDVLKCSLAIQTVVCDRIGSASEPFIVTIKSNNYYPCMAMCT